MDWKNFKIDFDSYFNGNAEHSSDEWEQIMLKVLEEIGKDGGYFLYSGPDFYEVRPISEMDTSALQPTAELTRAQRDEYLERYVDPVITNPLRWADLTAEEQQVYKDYRQYLLDIPESPDFPNVTILTLEDWRAYTHN